MSLPYFPFYVADYSLDTQHLSLEEHGAYLRLLCLCWTTPGCTVPDDPEWIRRRMGVDAATYERAVAPLLAEFFKRKDARLYSPRLLSIYQETDEKHKRRVAAGQKGGRPRKSLESNDTGQSNAKAMPKQPEPEPEPKVEEGKPSSVGATKRAATPPPKSRMTPDWRAGEEGWAFARSLGIPDDVIAEEERDFPIYWMDRRDRDASKSEQGWAVTWRNRMKAVAARMPRRAPNVIPIQQRGQANGRGSRWDLAMHIAEVADGADDGAGCHLLPARH